MNLDDLPADCKDTTSTLCLYNLGTKNCNAISLHKNRQVHFISVTLEHEGTCLYTYYSTIPPSTTKLSGSAASPYTGASVSS